MQRNNRNNQAILATHCSVYKPTYVDTLSIINTLRLNQHSYGVQNHLFSATLHQPIPALAGIPVHTRIRGMIDEIGVGDHVECFPIDHGAKPDGTGEQHGERPLPVLEVEVFPRRQAFTMF